jgi:hypothetical protein
MKSTSVPLSVSSGALGQLRVACKCFANGEQLPDALMSGLLPGAIARSWARSRDAGLMPRQPPEYELPGSEGGTPDDRRLRSCVIDEIEQLTRSAVLLWSASLPPLMNLHPTIRAGTFPTFLTCVPSMHG